MANKRRILTVILLIVVLALVSWLLLRPDPEPTYQGKPLSYWLDGFSLENPHPVRIVSGDAVRHIGTNAIPTLLRWLKGKQDSKLKLKLFQLVQLQHLLKLKWRTAETQQFEAAIGFNFLGPQGKSAVPALIGIYNEHRSGINNDPATIAEIFANMGPAAADAVPLLVQATTDTNSVNLRWSAVRALGEIHAKPDLAVPALMKSLTSMRDFPDEGVRDTAAASLAAFGSDAKSAIPELIKALSDPSARVGIAAASALKKIDPDAAAKAGVK